MKRSRRDVDDRGVRDPAAAGPGDSMRIEDRFFVDALPEGRALELTGREAVHAVGSRRLRPGDAVTLFDGSGWDVTAAIVEAGSKRIVLEERVARLCRTSACRARRVCDRAPKRLP